MTRAARAAHAVLAVLALAAVGASRARAETPETVAAKPAVARSPAYPLVLLAQGDAVLVSEPDGAGVAGGNDPAAGFDLRVRRVRVGEDLRIGDWRLRAAVEWGPRGQPFTPVEGGRIPSVGPTRLTEAFVAWIPHRAYQLSLGAQRVPFSLSRQVDEADLRLPERAQVVAALAPDYRVGLAFTSDLGLLNLRIAGMSAATTFNGNMFDSGYLGAMRLGSDPIGPMGVTPWRRRADDPWYGWWRFSAGLSVLYGTLLAPRTLGLGGDAQLQWLRFTLTGEYVAEYLTTGGGWPHMGAVVEPGIFLWKDRLELVARGSWYRRPHAATPDPDDRADTYAAGGGLTFFAYESRVRLQAAFETRRTRGALLADSNWAIFRLTFAL